MSIDNTAFTVVFSNFAVLGHGQEAKKNCTITLRVNHPDGFTFGKELQDRSASLGATASASANPIWSLALSAGFLANAAYCVYLLNKKRSWYLFIAPRTPVAYWLGAVLMGLLWFGGIVGYGVGAASLGALGGILGWPVLMAMTVITANVLGAVTGEWRGASNLSRRYWWAGVASLVVAVYVIALGSAG